MKFFLPFPPSYRPPSLHPPARFICIFPTVNESAGRLIDRRHLMASNLELKVNQIELMMIKFKESAGRNQFVNVNLIPGRLGNESVPLKKNQKREEIRNSK